MAFWYRLFACIHSEVLLCTMSAVLIVTTMVVAFALLKLKMKKTSTTVGYQAV